uniref:glycosyltransferase family 29 protein n=1 Tax=Falsiroseomonas oryzae TaxID=2766473 RepID=UPI0022EA7FB9
PPDPAALPPALARLATAREVALVGNGSGPLGRGQAAEIEAHDCVTRLNYPVLDGFAADVGRRTDVMLFNQAKRAELPQLVQREPGYAALPALSLAAWAPKDQPDPPALPAPFAPLVGQVGYRRGTAGFQAILLIALLLHRPVTLYGFDFFRAGQPGHYYGPATAALGHELAYERWFCTTFLPLLHPALRIAA